MDTEQITEEEGVKMILALQGLVGIEEPEDVAKANWNRFQDWEKKQTKMAYDMNIDAIKAKGLI